jgi:cyclophilin family peptidyl-prolyl cis-trans isomerase
MSEGLKKNINKPIIINITQSWAPVGANHLFDLISSQFYSVPSAFFRVVPNFVVQFGISGEPSQNKIWDKPIKDGELFLNILFIYLFKLI